MLDEKETFSRRPSHPESHNNPEIRLLRGCRMGGVGWGGVEGDYMLRSGSPWLAKRIFGRYRPRTEGLIRILGSKVHASQQHRLVGRYRYLAQLNIHRVELSIFEALGQILGEAKSSSSDLSQKQMGAHLFRSIHRRENLRLRSEVWATTAAI